MEEIAPIAFLSSWALVVPFLERVFTQEWDYSELTEDNTDTTVDLSPTPLQVAIKAALQRVNEMELYEHPISTECY